jgi:hypothetical protein
MEECGMSLTIRDRHDDPKHDALQINGHSQHTSESIGLFLLSVHRFHLNGEVYGELTALWLCNLTTLRPCEMLHEYRTNVEQSCARMPSEPEDEIYDTLQASWC